MSGRAGRRGKDDRGIVIQMLDEKVGRGGLVCLDTAPAAPVQAPQFPVLFFSFPSRRCAVHPPGRAPEPSFPDISTPPLTSVRCVFLRQELNMYQENKLLRYIQL